MKLTKKQEALIGKNEIIETVNSKGGYTGNYRLVGRDFDYVDLPGSGGKVTIEAAIAFIAKREGRAEVRASASRANGAKGGRPAYTYARSIAARTPSGIIVTVPDQVADDQPAYDGKSFPAILDGAKVRVQLRGDLYGLHTGGTGDMVVTLK